MLWWFWRKKAILLKTKLSRGIRALQNHPRWRRGLPPEQEEWDTWGWGLSRSTGRFVRWQRELKWSCHGGPQHRTTGCCSVGVPAFFPSNKICKVLGNAKIFQSSERFAGAEICFTSLLYTSAFSQGLFKTSPKLLYSRVAAEKAPISRRVTFALRCAYLFIVYKSREQLNQTHSKIPSPMYTVIKGNLGACCTSNKTINLHILHKGPEYKYNNLLKLSSSTLVF